MYALIVTYYLIATQQTGQGVSDTRYRSLVMCEKKRPAMVGIMNGIIAHVGVGTVRILSAKCGPTSNKGAAWTAEP
jgi:hypothetical protein